MVEILHARSKEQCLKNLSKVLEQAGGSIQSVIKVTVFIKDMAQFSKINEVYSRFFKDHKPARSCVEVSSRPFFFFWLQDWPDILSIDFLFVCLFVFGWSSCTMYM
jgi:enamine deaminase RidA (YjgF/YER057c/UK114 family)